MNIDVDTHVTWTTHGPYGQRRRKGMVRAFVPAGQPLPAGVKTRCESVNLVHDRYLVEVPRVSGRGSDWLVPKAKTLESEAV